MKKFLLSIFAVMLAVFSVHAEEYTYTFSASQFSANSTKTLNDVDWTLDGDGGYWGYDATKGQQFGSGGAPYKSMTFSTSGISGTITKIVVNTSGAKSIAATARVTVGGANFGEVITLTNTATDYSFTGTASGDIVLSYTQTSSKAIYIKSISVTYTIGDSGEGEGGGEETPVAPAAPTLPAACNFDDAMTVEITGIAEGATAYYSLNDENNWVEGTSVEITETTTVYAKAVKDELSSDVVSATYTKLEEGTMMITFATNATDKTQAATIDNFVSDHIKEHNFETTLTCSATNNCYVGVSGLKMSSGSNNGSFTLSLGASYKVASIIVRAIKYSSDAASVTVNEATAQALTTSMEDYTFDVNSEISQIKVDMTKRGYIESIMVVCEEGAVTPEPVAPAAPTLTESQTFSGSMTVTITSDATVYYTTDGTEPSATNGTEYTGSFEITATTTVKAIAVNEVGSSEVAEATYTLVETITLSNCTVAELIAAYTSGNNIADDATVVGYIVGCVDGTAISQAVFGTEVKTNTNILLADDPYETNIDNCIPVQLPSGTVRDALNLKDVDNSGNYQKKVILTGDVEKYFGVAALKSTSAYEFVDEIYVTHTVTDAGWATLYFPIVVRIPSAVQAYIVTTVNDGWVELTEVTGAIPANTGIIINAPAGDYNYYDAESATADVTGNLLKGSIASTYITEEAYVLGVDDGEVGLYKAEMNQLDGTAWLNNPSKAYLPASAVPNKSAAFYGFDWNGTTGIDEITDNRVQSTVIYDLTGRRVEEITEPGIYIVGGKKVLVK